MHLVGFYYKNIHDARSSECQMSKNQKNMKKCDKLINHVSNKPHTIYISSNNYRHPVTKTFAPLHLSTLHFIPFKLQPTTIH